MKSTKAHIVLSSGGVRCVSYAGAIAELEKIGVEVASVSACSGGSLVGALYCAGLSAEEVEKQSLALDFNDFFSGRNYFWYRYIAYPFSKYSTSRVAEVFCRLVGGDPAFEDLKIPFATLGIDIISRRFLVYSKKTDPQMKVSEALKIAMAIPAQTPLHQPPGKIVVDAAVATESPVWLATDYDDDLPIIVLKPKRKLDVNEPSSLGNFVEKLLMSGVESRDRLLINQIPGVAVVEIDCGDVESYDFGIGKMQKEILIQSGRTAVRDAVERYGADFSSNTTHFNPPETSGDRDSVAANSAERMIAKFNRKLPELLRDQIFISYSHKDRQWLERLQTALKPFVRNQSFKVWADEQIQVGELWQKEIDQALASTKVAVLLVTEDFLASDYINDVELKHFIEQSKKRHVVIFWIAVTATNFEETPLKDIQCANDPSQPLASFANEYEQDKAIVEICRKIKTVFNQQSNL
jgi:predicted acylesterase/phospholipase RssA